MRDWLACTSFWLCFAVLVGAGYLGDVEGARNTAAALAWLVILPSAFCGITDAAITRRARVIPSGLPSLNIPVLIAAMLVLTWYGAWGTLIPVAVSGIIAGAARLAVQDERDRMAGGEGA